MNSRAGLVVTEMESQREIRVDLSDTKYRARTILLTDWKPASEGVSLSGDSLNTKRNDQSWSFILSTCRESRYVKRA